MKIEVLRIGQRLVRDDRVTTHVALVARAFGASKILMTEVNPEIKDTITGVNQTWGGDFRVEMIDGWRQVLAEKKKDGYAVAHLSMYGQKIGDVQEKMGAEERLLVVVGAEKVPREVYEMADYNVAAGSQPHSEVSALAVLLDRVQQGAQFDRSFSGAKRRIIPSENGKSVEQD
ncbi:MAG: tRNA (cytidine(56)-2'-O)-methyltransferase [Nitrosopumilus sp. B06]|nr:MAG: tRNA (cytidine(56)-2'-O)-methyltransferase [Nitrosopumilus sp. D6]RNJ79769.1 MAG: tRNA (cytidine(56)-2'-O)-methyltransferase [Nitrosopumilus sp. B06]